MRQQNTQNRIPLTAWHSGCANKNEYATCGAVLAALCNDSDRVKPNTVDNHGIALTKNELNNNLGKR